MLVDGGSGGWRGGLVTWHQSGTDSPWAGEAGQAGPQPTGRQRTKAKRCDQGQASQRVE